MSSWLDTKKFVTSLAKTAMAEAQKTLDKALEVDEEAEQNGVSFSASFFDLPQSNETIVSLQPKSESEPISLQLKAENKSALMEECEEEEMSSSNNTMTSVVPIIEEASEASSSSKSYEMLKLDSGHTSGDDVEVITNTSSDIEVISSPLLSENSRKSIKVSSPTRKEPLQRHLKKGKLEHNQGKKLVKLIVSMLCLNFAP